MTQAPRRSGGFALAGLVLLLACWVGANPPGLSPDEPAHYRRAVGLAWGVVLGEEATYRAAYNITESELAWLNRTTRAVPVPEALRGCGIFRVQVAGRCPVGDAERTATGPLPAGTEATYVGTYPPFAYLLPAGAIRLAHAAGFAGTGALLAGRAAVAALCAALVAAAGALRPRDRVDPAGLVGLAALAVAVSPLAAFLFAELSGNGPEIAAAIAVTSALLAVTRPRPPRGAAAVLGAAGLVLATSRSTGPLYVAELVALVALLRGRAAFALLRRPGVLGAAAVTGVGVGASVAWQLLAEPSPARTVAGVLAGVRPALRTLDTVWLQAAGVMGWRDVGTPAAAKAVWLVLVAGLAATALLAGGRGARRALVGAAVLVVATVVVIFAAVIRPTSPDFDMQGRYVLAVIVALPLIAGEVIAPQSAEVRGLLHRSTVRAAPLVLLAAAMLHVIAVVANLHHYATSAGFAKEVPGGWLPTGGWPPWVGLALAAFACAAVAARPPSSDEPTRSGRPGRPGRPAAGNADRSAVGT